MKVMFGATKHYLKNNAGINNSVFLLAVAMEQSVVVVTIAPSIPRRMVITKDSSIINAGGSHTQCT